jgi:prepilin peptidase CpaA
VQAATLVVAVGLLTIVVERDVRTRHIPNELALAITTLGLLRLIVAHQLVTAILTVAAAAVVFAAAFFFFWRGVLGGGDVKLVAATALLVGYHDFFRFLFLMSLCGAALALFTLAQGKLGLRLSRISRCLTLPTEMAVEQREALSGQSSVPYGAAISVAGAVILALQTSFAW